MNETTLIGFRQIAQTMIEAAGPANWQWNGPHASQQMYGITQERAEGYAKRFGGIATNMEDCQ